MEEWRWPTIASPFPSWATSSCGGVDEMVLAGLDCEETVK